MRVLISIFLCLAVAFQGMAYAHAFELTCSMTQGHSEVAADHAVFSDDCCNDADTAAKTGQACKTGQSCTPLGTFADALLEAKTPHPMASISQLTGVLFVPSADPSSIWRPPLLS
jgi:hypothetical protein